MQRGAERQEKTLAVGGGLVVLAALVLVEGAALQAAAVLAGLLVVQAGIWGIPGASRHDRREYHRLREETEIFLEQVRALNELAVEGESGPLRRQRRRLHDQVERLSDVAGLEA